MLSCDAFSVPTSADQDLATFNVSDRCKPLFLDLAPVLHQGDEVLVLGFPAVYDGGPVASLGHITFPRKDRESQIATTASVSPGLSGAIALKIGWNDRLSVLGHAIYQS